MKRDVKKEILEIIFSVLMIFNTIAFMFPNGIFSKLSVYFMTQFFLILV